MALQMMAEKDDSCPCEKNMKLPICIFFKDARYYFE